MTVQNNQGHQAEIDGFGIDEARSLKRLLTRFMKEYGKKPAEQSDQEWLKARFLAEMPEMSEEEAEALSRETVKTIYQYDENLKSLKSARKKGKPLRNGLPKRHRSLLPDCPPLHLRSV